MKKIKYKKNICLYGLVGILVLIIFASYILRNNKNYKGTTEDKSRNRKENTDREEYTDTCEILNLKDNDGSEVIIYNNDKFEVVPNDLLQKDKRYVKILEKYKLDTNINEENIGKLLLCMKNGTQIFQSKIADTDEVLVMKDDRDEFVYLFKLHY